MSLSLRPSLNTLTTNYIYDTFWKVIQETTIPTSGTSYPTVGASKFPAVRQEPLCAMPAADAA